MKRLICLCVALALFALGTAAQAEPSAPGSGKLLLTVSKITLSVVGDSEQIYAGTADADEVVWDSSDPSVISVDHGVITAKCVGSATIRAFFENQVVECLAECLAESVGKLQAMPASVLQAPKRIPPKVDLDPTAFFSDAAMIGDSVTCNLMVYENRTNLLGHPLFLARKNIGVHNFYHHIINLFYQGREMYVENAVAASGVKKAIFLLGTNDLGYQTAEEVLEKYAAIIDRVQANAPGVQLYLQSALPWYSGNGQYHALNQKIDQFNLLLAQLAEEKGCFYIDISAYIEDHIHSMAREYTADYEAHLNEAGSMVWMDVLRAYAYLHA